MSAFAAAKQNAASEPARSPDGAVAAINSGNREKNREIIPKPSRQKGLNPSEAK
jgi:hypothetical protein